MDLRLITPEQKDQYNKLVTHVTQSWEWGEFRRSLGLPLLRYGIYKNGKLSSAFQLTLHKIPLTKQFVGYLPKGPAPDKDLFEALIIIGPENNCAYIKVEPNIIAKQTPFSVYHGFQQSPKPLFTKYNFILDVTKTEAELFKNMHPKTRYNIRLAQKKGVLVEERTDDKAFEIYLKLYFETCARQKYFGHNPFYHKKVWNTLKEAGMARLIIGFYNKKPLSVWLLLSFQDTLYYPYGGSSIQHKDVMANNLVAWETIKLAKKLELNTLDMWGALGPNADPKHPWFGFHDFKRKYGSELVEYVGTYDLIFNETLYHLFNFFDKQTRLKNLLLKLIK